MSRTIWTTYNADLKIVDEDYEVDGINVDAYNLGLLITQDEYSMVVEGEDTAALRKFAQRIIDLCDERDGAPTGVCKHCERQVTLLGGQWVNVEATGDDRIWFETCEDNHDFPAPHEVDWHGEHAECADGCGLDVDHDPPCRERPGGRIITQEA